MSDKISIIVKEVLLKYENRFGPVLVHGDCGPTNQILSEEGDLFMIDWDYARRGVWLEDLVPIILSAGQFSETEQVEEVTLEIRKSFLKGYGVTEYSEKEIIEIERVFIAIAYLYNLSFYSSDSRNLDAATHAKEKLNELMNDA
ncbi:phosphotransferase [Candidatus Uhrbacteria bacterium]|nr:phosphotransferase [Candidatus Uhrbacteria bacterium]